MCVRSFKTTKVYFAMKVSCVKIWIASQGIYTNSVFPVSASTHHERGGDVFWMQSQQELIHWEWNNIFSNSRTMMRPKNSNLSVPSIPVTNKILNGKAMCWVFCVCSEESSLRMLQCIVKNINCISFLVICIGACVPLCIFVFLCLCVCVCVRPDICHFFSTNVFLGSIFLHIKARKLWQKIGDDSYIIYMPYVENFRFLLICHVETSEISPHVETSEISPHVETFSISQQLSYTESWSFSTWQSFSTNIISNISDKYEVWCPPLSQISVGHIVQHDLDPENILANLEQLAQCSAS